MFQCNTRLLLLFVYKTVFTTAYNKPIKNKQTNKQNKTKQNTTQQNTKKKKTKKNIYAGTTLRAD